MHNTEGKSELNVNGDTIGPPGMTNGEGLGLGAGVPGPPAPPIAHGAGVPGPPAPPIGHGAVRVQSTREPVGVSGGAKNECAGCGKRITDRFLLKALDMYWHEDCLKCGCCDCRLGEVGSTLYTKANLILCKRDYLRLFGSTGYCAACSKVIPAFEMVMRARNNVYHLECFACQQCNHRFCVGDRFYLCENKILCEYDYEERMVFANMTYSPGNLAILRSSNNQEGKTGGSSPAMTTTNNVGFNNSSGSSSPKLQALSPSSTMSHLHHSQPHLLHHHIHPPIAQRTAT